MRPSMRLRACLLAVLATTAALVIGTSPADAMLIDHAGTDGLH